MVTPQLQDSQAMRVLADPTGLHQSSLANQAFALSISSAANLMVQRRPDFSDFLYRRR